MRVNGDPHFVTYDNLTYDLQAVGEFVLTKNANFEIQVRTSPYGTSKTVSIVTGVAVSIGSHRVTLENGVLRLDGAQFALGASPINLGAGELYSFNGGFEVKYGTREVVAVGADGTANSSGYAVSVSLPKADAGTTVGLLGNDDGKPANDFQLPDGTVLKSPLSTQQLYQVFGNAWRVSGATSLFDYGPGQTTSTYTNLNYPVAPVSVSAFPSALVAEATALAQAAGITDSNLLADAVYDYLASGGDKSFLTAAASLQAQLSAPTGATTSGVVASATTPTAGVIAPAATIVDGASGAPVTFQVYRTGDTSSALTLSYSVVAPSDAYVDASYFGGTLPTGAVTIVAGQKTASLTIDVTGDLGSAPTKQLEVSIASSDPSISLLNSTATATIANGQPVEGVDAIAGFSFSTGFGTPSNNGTVLDLGVIPQGDQTQYIGAIVQNLAPDSTNVVGGTFNVSGQGFSVTGANSFAGVAGGSFRSGLYLLPDTSSAGSHSTTITLHSTNSNASGFSAALPDETLTVEDTVVAPPVINVPSTVFSGTEGALIAVTGVSITDSAPAAPGYADTVTLSDPDGLLSATSASPGGGDTISGAGTQTLTITGSVDEINADLASLSVVSNVSGASFITISAQDGYGLGAAATGLVTVNASPALTVGISVAASLVDGASDSTTVTFTFSEVPVDFSLADVTAADGVLSNLSGSATSYSATFTANSGVDDTTATVSIAANTYHDVAGNGGEAGSSSSFTVDTLPPTVTISSSGGVTNQASQSISGTVSATEAAAGSTVTIFDGATQIATAALQNDGSWTATVSLLNEGANSITAEDTDAAGNTGTSSPVTFALDTLPPTVAITSSGGLTNQPSQTISGTVSTTEAAAGSMVTLFDGVTQVGTAALQSDGSWSANVSLLNEGANSVTAEDTDAAGNTGTSSPVTFTLDTQPPTVAITSAGATTTQATQTIAGTVSSTEAAAGSMVTLYDNGAQVATAELQSDGSWSTTIGLKEGSNSVTAEDTDAAGNTGTSGAVPFTFVPAVTVATYLGEQSTLDGLSGGFDILDAAANVPTGLDALNGDTHLGSIALSDGGTPTLKLTIEEALSDGTALGKITSAYTPAIWDSPADIAGLTAWQASALHADDYAALNATGPTALTIAEADLLSSDRLVVNGTVTFDVSGGSLKSTDRIVGGTGSTTLALQGAGTFNLAAPSALTNVQTVTAQEGQAAYATGGQTFPAQNQVVDLRAGTSLAIDVSGDPTLNLANPKPATITIVGAANSDTINLAKGNDVVTLGGPNETVNLGLGNDTINATAATIGAAIGNGTGTNALDVSGGGTMAMGSNIADVSSVLLASSTTAYHFTANAISGLTVTDASTATSDSLTASGANQILTGGGAGKLAFTGSSAGSDTFKDKMALFNHDTVAGFGDNSDAIDLTDLNSADPTTLGWSQAVGSSTGALTVTDTATHASTTITLVGLLTQYSAGAFHAGADLAGTGTAITYDPHLIASPT